MKVFSFCIFGNQQKYLDGLIKNIEIINKEFPDFYIWIYSGTSITAEYIKKLETFHNIKYIQTKYDDMKLAYIRLLPIEDQNVEIFFSRDTDSRITERDIWCINEFIKSDKKYHTIRDHYYHKSNIMVGLFGAKQNNITISDKFIELDNSNGVYNIDVDFMNKYLWDTIKDNLLIHTNIVAFKDEHTFQITVPMKNNNDFVGNVYEFDENNNEYCKFNYFDNNLMNHINWLDKEKQLEIISRIGFDIEQFIMLYKPHERNPILDKIYVANYYINNIQECQRILSLFKYTHVTEHNIKNSNYLFPKMNKKIIGTCNPNRIPKKNEIIICYGSYCHDVYNLPFTNKIYRNAIYYDMILHHHFEYDNSWKDIDRIYIINLVERKDRYFELLCELSRLYMPLDRIFHVKGYKNNITDNKLLNSYLGATHSHLEAIQDMKKNKYKHCLILEDDFIFNCNYDEIKKNIKTFFERKYVYDVCLISASKYHEIKPYDDLLSLSYQECTTTSGYLVSENSVDKVLKCFDDGYHNMLKTKDYHTYVCDRYWAKLQKDNKFYLFNQKFGYQRITLSDIQNNVNFNFD